MFVPLTFVFKEHMTNWNHKLFLSRLYAFRALFFSFSGCIWKRIDVWTQDWRKWAKIEKVPWGRIKSTKIYWVIIRLFRHVPATQVCEACSHGYGESSSFSILVTFKSFRTETLWKQLPAEIRETDSTLMRSKKLAQLAPSPVRLCHSRALYYLYFLSVSFYVFLCCAWIQTSTITALCKTAIARMCHRYCGNTFPHRTGTLEFNQGTYGRRKAIRGWLCSFSYYQLHKLLGWGLSACRFMIIINFCTTDGKPRP